MNKELQEKTTKALQEQEEKKERKRKNKLGLGGDESKKEGEIVKH